MPDTPIPDRLADDSEARDAPRPIGANTPLRLTGPDHCVEVVHGVVDVFAVRLDGGAPTGPRHPIFRAVAGDIVLGLPGDGTIGLILVGGLGAQVRDGTDGPGQSIQARADALDRYVIGLLRGLDVGHPPASPRVLEPGDEGAVAAATPIASREAWPLWVEEATGRTLWFLGASTAAAKCLPTTAAAWLAVAEDGLFKTYRTVDLIARGGSRETVAGFLDAYTVLLRVCLDARNRTDRERVDKLVEAESAALTAALRAMGGTFGSAQGTGGGDRAGGDPLASVFQMVMQALDVPAPSVPVTGTGTGGREEGQCLDAMARAWGVRTRKILLRDGWWRRDGGPMIGFLSDGGHPVALLPRKRGGYILIAPHGERERKVGAAEAARLSPEALAPYRPLPAGVSSLGGLARFVLPMIRGDLRRIGVVGVLGGLLAAVTPMLTGHLIEDVLPRAALGQHVQVVLALGLIAFGAGAFEIVKVMALMRIEGRADLALQAALFDRLLRLPTKFYRRFTSGDLADRVLGIQTIRQTVTGTTLASLLGLLFSLFSLLVLFYYSWRLALIAVAIVVAAAVVIALLGRLQLREERARMALQGRAEGFVLQMMSAIGKLRTAGAERRAYAQWGMRYAAQKHRYVAAQKVANHQAFFQSILPVVAAAVIFSTASVLLESAARDQRLYGLLGTQDDPVVEPMTTGGFIAFNTAFGQFLLAMTTLVSALTRVLAVIPLFERLQPILEAPTEEDAVVGDPRRAVRTLGGGIAINQVSFRYGPTAKPVLDGLSLSIAPKEFVAIVGPSGSGKSTLVRLLLGFETPDGGDILFDGTPLHGLDLASVRRQVQVVLQHARLSGGSLFSNIAGGRQLDEEAVWRAVRQAGLEADVDALPMGLHTVVTEGVNTFSGGQRQRMMIARALAQEPAVLVLDEPTSALDNATQDRVMNTLANVNATRILIAHRLSTVSHVDRILVMDGGRVVESGGFDELMEKGGLFADIAKRQKL